jgi:hypothetical protein
VLLPTYQFNDNIVFNSEFELKHAGAGFDADDKLHGTAEIELAYVDFRISPYFNIRAPGIDLVPIDWLNLYHEPTNFYSVLRPEFDNGLIPTTWKAPMASIWGQIVEGLNYQFQITQALEDFGGDFSLRNGRQHRSAVPAWLCARHRRPKRSRFFASAVRRFPSAQQLSGRH